MKKNKKNKRSVSDTIVTGLVGIIAVGLLLVFFMGSINVTPSANIAGTSILPILTSIPTETPIETPMPSPIIVQKPPQQVTQSQLIDCPTAFGTFRLNPAMCEYAQKTQYQYMNQANNSGGYKPSYQNSTPIDISHTEIPPLPSSAPFQPAKIEVNLPPQTIPTFGPPIPQYTKECYQVGNSDYTICK